MRNTFLILLSLTLAACGVETASTAATAAAVKKQELDQGRKTLDGAQQKVQGAVGQMQQRSDSADR